MRRLRLIASICVVLMLAAALSACSTKSVGDSPMFLANPQHTRVVQEKALTEYKSTKWKYNLGGNINATPAIAGDTAYIGNEEGSFAAVDLSTGKELWKFKAGGAINSTACVDGGKVYFFCEDGSLYALDAQKGGKLWSVKTGDKKSSPKIEIGRAHV